ncbi:hypothetical protein LTR66_015802 [Elasticomyces elasticus]|nr:hypothetical protein LTR66_015802 [Elasticomyces elasticus]
MTRQEEYTRILQSLRHEESTEVDLSAEIRTLEDITNPGTVETMSKVSHLVTLKQNLQSEHTTPEESHILDLQPFFKEAVDLGILSPEVQSARRARAGPKGHHIWRQEIQTVVGFGLSMSITAASSLGEKKISEMARLGYKLKSTHLVSDMSTALRQMLLIQTLLVD